MGVLALATTAAGAVILTRSVDYGLQDARALYSKIESGGTKGTVELTRDVSETSQLEKGAFSNLKYEGEVSGGGRSGGARPQTGTPNSYVQTSAGHYLVYDSEGRLIFDVSSQRVKMYILAMSSCQVRFLNGY